MYVYHLPNVPSRTRQGNLSYPYQAFDDELTDPDREALERTL